MSVPPSVRFSLRWLHELLNDKQRTIMCLQTWRAIPEEPNYLCPKCGGSLILRQYERHPDGYHWVCPNTIMRARKRVRCGKRISLRTGTFFDKSKLAMWQILTFVYLWVRNSALCLIAENAEISNKTATNWASFCREVLFLALAENQTPLGGEGVVVEIDESKFGKNKNGRGRPVIGQWVLGGFERGTGRVFLVTVENRTAETLIPIITGWVLPGTTIITDCWRTYNCLPYFDYDHSTVNHRRNFVDPQTGAHTNSIEATWRAAKYVMSEPGRRKGSIPGNLAKYIFQKRCRSLELEPMKEFLRLAGQLYNPMNPPNGRLPVMEERDGNGEEEEDEEVVEEEEDELEIEDEEEGDEDC